VTIDALAGQCGPEALLISRGNHEGSNPPIDTARRPRHRRRRWTGVPMGVLTP